MLPEAMKSSHLSRAQALRYSAGNNDTKRYTRITPAVARGLPGYDLAKSLSDRDSAVSTGEWYKGPDGKAHVRQNDGRML